MTVVAEDYAPGQGRVAVLGLGTIGAGMARSLLRAGLPVDVWNRTPERAADLAGAGAVAHTGPAGAVADAGVAITILSDAAATRSVALDAGMLAAMRPGAVWAQMGTIGVSATEELAGIVTAQRPDVMFVDAPVSGTRAPAEAGELLVLASGPERARPLLEPVFGAVGQATRWLGAAGAGSRLKLVMNTWLMFLIEGAAEVMALADAVGVDRSEVLDLLGNGRMASPVAAAKARKMDSGDDSPDFALALAVKDMSLALDAAPGWSLDVLRSLGGRQHPGELLLALVHQRVRSLQEGGALAGERQGVGAAVGVAPVTPDEPLCFQVVGERDQGGAVDAERGGDILLRGPVGVRDRRQDGVVPGVQGQHRHLLVGAPASRRGRAAKQVGETPGERSGGRRLTGYGAPLVC